MNGNWSASLNTKTIQLENTTLNPLHEFASRIFGVGMLTTSSSPFLRMIDLVLLFSPIKISILGMASKLTGLSEIWTRSEATTRSAIPGSGKAYILYASAPSVDVSMESSQLLYLISLKYFSSTHRHWIRSCGSISEVFLSFERGCWRNRRMCLSDKNYVKF